MDAYSYQMGNVLLKNKKSAATIEITFGGARFLFEENTYVCLTGADFSPKINDIGIKMNKVIEVKKGDILSFGRRNYGVRTYLAVQGGIQTETILKSRSYFSNITLTSRLEKGDVLSFSRNDKPKNMGNSSLKILDFLFTDINLECFPGPEFYLLNDEQKNRLTNKFTISGDNNRVGYRLEEVIKNNLKPILTSAVLPGTIQLTPSGKLIVLMKDCQVTGGYPRVLQLSNFAISQLSQKITGQKIKFSLK